MQLKCTQIVHCLIHQIEYSHVNTAGDIKVHFLILKAGRLLQAYKNIDININS